MKTIPRYLLLPLLVSSCAWFKDDPPPKTWCHEAGRIPYEDLRPVGAEEGGDSIWIRGTVPGVSEGQVRFHERVDGRLALICLGIVCDEKFEIEAPSYSDEPIHLSVTHLAAGEPVEGSHQWGALEESLPLLGSDHQVQFELGQTASWTRNLNPGVDRIAQVEDVYHREEASPP